MKVYALFSGEYSDTTFHGVYSTREKAQAQIDRAVAKIITAGAPRRYCTLADDGTSGPRIDEVEIDDEAYEFWSDERKYGVKGDKS